MSFSCIFEVFVNPKNVYKVIQTHLDSLIKENKKETIWVDEKNCCFFNSFLTLKWNKMETIRDF